MRGWNYPWGIGIWENGTLYGYFRDKDGVAQLFNAGYPAANTWQHIAYKAKWGTGQVWLYLNGVQVGTYTWTAGAATPSTQTVAIGAGGVGTAQWFGGLIDEVRIYNRVLTPTEVAEHYKGKFNNESGLVGYWPFSEQSGTKTYDKSGQGNHGTLYNFNWTSTSGWQNNAPKYAAGAPAASGGSQGNAMQFDGVDDYVSVPDSASLDITAAITIEAWIKSAGTSYKAIVGKFYYSAPYSYGYSFYLHSGGEIRFTIYSGSNGSGEAIGTANLHDNKWHFVTGVYDGSNITVYVDGQLAKTESLAYGPAVNAVDLRVGRFHPGQEDPTKWFNGLIDNVRIYNRALSATEVRYHYNKGGPVAYWKFDEGSGQTAYDSTNNNNDGRLGSSTDPDSADPTWTSGKYGSALSFDGVNDYVSLGTNQILYPTAFTVEAWIKMKTTATTDRALINWRSVDNRPTLYLSGPSGPYFYRGYESGVGGNARTWAYSPVNIVDGNWHHVAFTIPGKAAADINNAKLYADGQEQDILSTSAANNVGIMETAVLGTAQSTYWADMEMDEFKIYNYVRTPEQIRIDYNAGLSVHFK